MKKFALMLGILVISSRVESMYFVNAFEAFHAKDGNWHIHNNHNGKNAFDLPNELVVNIISTSHPEKYVKKYQLIKAYVN